jgi:surface antigen
VCRSRERALQFSVAHHPDARSYACWATSFDEAGQGSLYSDVQNFADDDDGHVALVEHIASVSAEWAAGFSIKVSARADNH